MTEPRHDIMVTHRSGRKVDVPFALHNEVCPERARRQMRRLAARFPQYRMAVVERDGINTRTADLRSAS